MGFCLRCIFSLVFVLTASGIVSAQDTTRSVRQSEPADSVVRLLSGKSAEIIEKDDVTYRKVVGPARFLHNDTYLLCDTALWNVDAKIIRLDKIIPSHTASFTNDYTMLMEQAKNELSMKAIDDFINEKLATTYIVIDPLFRECTFDYDGWYSKFRETE